MMGRVEHGLRIVRELAAVTEPFRERFRLAVKFQYRHVGTFIMATPTCTSRSSPPSLCYFSASAVRALPEVKPLRRQLLADVDKVFLHYQDLLRQALPTTAEPAPTTDPAPPAPSGAPA